ncbi:MAG TPA: MBL fold metallo-hydrolase [Polyangiaceae bacterium]|nr:MBL fold metallo-hydrolase [Polyangiaceae bacterium]
MSSRRYLKPNVSVEPLYNQWYAWWYLLSPATAPLFVVNLHLKLMASFVSAPEVHVAALQNPALAGGPFINYRADRAGEVRELLERTAREQADTLAFARALVDLDKLLAAAPAGLSLEGLYPRVPAPLRGFVELTYDLNHRPSPRLLEGLLYRSRHHRESCQSVALREVSGDARHYVFSTPRLNDADAVHLPRPFRDAAFDALFRSKDEPSDPAALADALGVRPDDRALFASLFTDAPPPPRAPPFDGPGVRVRYFGHACVLLETRDVCVLTDPVLSYDVPADPPRFSYRDLPETIDYVVITHGHADHLMLETLLQLRARIGTVIVPRAGGGLADPSLKLMLEHCGFRSVRELDELETVAVEGGAITGLPFFGEHADLNIRAKLAHLVELGGKRFLMAADSNAIEPELYERLRETIGGVDALFLGMECEGAPMSWMYGPLLAAALPRKLDQSRRLNGSNCARALAIVDALGPREVYVYAMGREPWLGHVMALRYDETSPQIVESDRLLRACRERGIVAERPFARLEIT